MYSIPKAFADRFDQAFQGRLRIRWSQAKHEFHIEQRVARALSPLSADDTFHDRYIRARDGYAFVLAVKAGNHMPCKTCGLKCEVPMLRTGEIRCGYCEHVKERPARMFGGYWPLAGDALIEHLRRIDPLRDGHIRSIAEAQLAEDRAQLTRVRDTKNTIEASTFDNQYQLFGTARAYMNDATRSAKHS